MALELGAATAFEKDLRRLEKQRKDLDKLRRVSDSATSILIDADSPCLRIWRALCSN
jgi:hypothetical protein